MVLSLRSPFATLPSLLGTLDPFSPTVPQRALVDVQKTEDGYRLQAALPGFKPEEVEVTLEQGTLTISGKRSEEKRTEQGRYLRREVFAGSFTRRFALPADVAAEDVQASFENGMLTVDVKVAPERGAVKIPVGGAALPEPAEQTEQPAA
ncbi:MAG TPA: Hsp20/alpha crystallin family protein [Candidatus Dormibacteraeota bacterium]|nr:Hsp20/alpha crystallin family protein [Candidatus Dormibacteraeota bacterium]